MKRTQSGYLFQSNGAWYCRYREADGKQRAHRLGSVADVPKKSDAKVLQQEYMKKVNATLTPQSGNTVGEFFANVFVPFCKEQGLGAGTLRNYETNWRLYLSPRIGHLRLRDVCTGDVQDALDSLRRERPDLGHGAFGRVKVTASAMFSVALRKRLVASNPVHGATIKGLGHRRHRENGAYTLSEIRQFLTLFTGQTAAVIGFAAFLGLRRPELEALEPSDFDGETVRIHRATKTGNDVLLPVIAPLKRLLPGWAEKINLEHEKYVIQKGLEGTGLKWRGFYAFRRGLATNLYEAGVPVETAALILRNSKEICSKHYIKLDEERKRSEAMEKLEQVFERVEAVQKASEGRPQ